MCKGRHPDRSGRVMNLRSYVLQDGKSNGEQLLIPFHVAAELVGGHPERGLKGQIRGGVRRVIKLMANNAGLPKQTIHSNAPRHYQQNVQQSALAGIMSKPGSSCVQRSNGCKSTVQVILMATVRWRPRTDKNRLSMSSTTSPETFPQGQLPGRCHWLSRRHALFVSCKFSLVTAMVIIAVRSRLSTLQSLSHMSVLAF